MMSNEGSQGGEVYVFYGGLQGDGLELVKYIYGIKFQFLKIFMYNRKFVGGNKGKGWEMKNLWWFWCGWEMWFIIILVFWGLVGRV